MNSFRLPIRWSRAPLSERWAILWGSRSLKRGCAVPAPGTAVARSTMDIAEATTALPESKSGKGEQPQPRPKYEDDLGKRRAIGRCAVCTALGAAPRMQPVRQLNAARSAGRWLRLPSHGGAETSDIPRVSLIASLPPSLQGR